MDTLLIIIFVPLFFHYLWTESKKSPVTLKGLLQATGFVLGLTFGYIFFTLIFDFLGVGVDGDQVFSIFLLLGYLLWAYRKIPNNLFFKETEIQLDILFFSK